MAKKSPPKKAQAGSKQSGSRKKNKVSAARFAAFKALQQVFAGQSLSVVQIKQLDSLDDQRDKGLAHELVNGVLRWRWQLSYYVSCLLSKPLKAKDHDVQLVLLLAMYELQQCRTPDYAIINEAVELVRTSGKRWADGLVNAVLRRFVREQETLSQAVPDGEASFSHPQWIIDRIRTDWPDNWQNILQANNSRPPLWLRVNARQTQTTDYLKQLQHADILAHESALSTVALKLDRGLDVTSLPDFKTGAVSVQDVGAQLCVEQLALSSGQNVLDLCAAPGGKTCHILESMFEIKQLVAVELEAKRMARVEENLKRLQLDQHDAITLIAADARDVQNSWQGELFDRILIDAPCSASGVIRRHPDIKTLRREEDIQALVALQAEILTSAWSLLKEGGEMLYVTCSIFKDENQNQLSHFIDSHDDAIHLEIKADWGVSCDVGRQLFPGEQDADGFYFCRIKKNK